MSVQSRITALIPFSKEVLMSTSSFPSATTLAESIRTGTRSAREVLEETIGCIEHVNPRLNALVMPRFEDARREADAADGARRRGDRLGALHGVPVTIKDQFAVAGLPTTLGVARLRHNVAAKDGAMVAALREAGAIVVGKTNVPQTLATIETDNPIWGRTHNPWDLTRTAGGSSGGEAALIAAGGSPLGLGGDFGGSLRIPAAYCGLCTIRPTARRLAAGDRFPVRTGEGAEVIVAQPGPLARTVDDVTLALRVMVDHVMAHPGALNSPVPFADPAAVDVSRLRIALLPQVSDWVPSPAIRRAMRESADALRAAGATVVEWTSAPDTTEGVLLFFRLLAASGFSSLVQTLGDESPIDLIKPNLQLTRMPPVLRLLLVQLLKRRGSGRLSRMVEAASLQSAAGYLDLAGDRLSYEQRMRAALDTDGFDAILLPASPLPAVRHGDTAGLADFWGSCLLFNVLGWPAGVVPVTRVRPGEESDRPDNRERTEQQARLVEAGSAGLPIGVQIAAPPWREDRILALMRVIEGQARTQADFPQAPSM